MFIAKRAACNVDHKRSARGKRFRANALRKLGCLLSRLLRAAHGVRMKETSGGPGLDTVN